MHEDDAPERPLNQDVLAWSTHENNRLMVGIELD
jgi:hypothetical protein